MRSIKVEYPKDLSRLEVHLFSDLHIGDKYCNMARIKERIEDVKNNENAVCILNGDIINNATRSSVSDSYAEQMTPMEQIQLFTELFSPIKEKIIALTSGNHENRSYKDDGLDITEVCARQLGIDERYSKTGALIFLRFGQPVRHPDRRMCYIIYATHGSGGGRKEGGKAVQLADMANIVDADIYVHGHTHLPMVMKQSFFRTDAQNSRYSKVDKLFVNTSAMLEYGGYGEAYGFKPSSIDCPTIYLDGRKKRFSAEL